MNYKYVAMDARGKEKKGVIDADNEAEAANKLKRQGLFPTAISVINPSLAIDAKARIKARVEKRREKGGLDRDDIYPRDRSLFEEIFGDDEEDKKGGLDAGMVLAVMLAVLFTAFRAKMDMEYVDLGIIMFILFIFGCWRGFVVTNLLSEEEIKT